MKSMKFNLFGKTFCVFVLCAGFFVTSCEGELPGGGKDVSVSDLSLSATANCYIVSEAGAYKIKAVKGNSSVSVGAVASAAVLWESFGTPVVPELGSLIKSTSYSDGYITFQTADTFKGGNAVIAAKDAGGDILWSWHIWLTDEPQGQEYYNNAGTMLDRNLGAASATSGDVGALGLLYQWGRKDPFLGSSSISSDIVAVSTTIWPSAVTSDATIGTIEYATANPMTFIVRNDHGDWYYTASSSADNTRWTESNSTKSIYDPCPAGWRVPDGGANSVWSNALGSYGCNFTFDSTNAGVNFSGKFGEASVIWYPASGLRSSVDGSLKYVGVFGRYCSASPDSDNAGRPHTLRFNSDYDYASLLNSIDHACGLPVRCLQE